MHQASPFTHMASVLEQRAPELLVQESDSKAGRIRAALRVHGSANSADLAQRARVPASMIQPIIKHDLALGRVLKVGAIYSWNHDYQDAVARAVSQLRHLGYTVTPPEQAQ